CGPKLIAWLSNSTVRLPGFSTTASSGWMSLICSTLRRLGRPRRRGRRAALGMHLLVARQRRDALPGREEIEAAPVLRQLHRRVDHRFLFLVVADLDIAGQREILAHRM